MFKRKNGIYSAIMLAIFTITYIASSFVFVTMARADDWEDETAGYYTVYGPDDKPLFSKSSRIYEDDEYISEDNKLYRIQSVDDSNLTARAVLIGDEEMPDVGDIWEAADEDLLSPGNAADAATNFSLDNTADAAGDPTLDNIAEAAGDLTLDNEAEAAAKKLVGMYCTHSDESYVPSDGVANTEKTKGGIFDVAKSLKTELEKKGVTVTLDETMHFPHDSGAYRRSRQTATSLLKSGPVALFDIHRDATPPDEYEKTINGNPATRVRLLVGRSNQNMQANKDFAKKIKAVADKKYPGVIKDIFIGKGNYNQELLPNSVLLEFGTHEMDKERAIESTKIMADVINRALFGAATSANVGGGTGGGTTGAGKNKSAAETPAASSNSGSMTGIFWVLGLAAVGAVVYAFFATGGKGFGHKLRRGASEVTGGLIPPREGDRDRHNGDDGDNRR